MHLPPALRRDILRWAAALLAQPVWPLWSGGTTPRFTQDPFGLGIASGTPSADGFVLWTRLTGREATAGPDVPVLWEVLEDRSPETVLARGQTTASAALGFAVHAEPAGLPPDRWYRYRFTAGGVRSTTGRTRTLPRADTLPARLRLAFASCQRWEDGHYAAYRQMREDAPDLVLFLGDYIYEYASRQGPQAVRTHSLPHIRDLDGYRQRYALYRSDPLLQQMHAACPWLLTWDDYEVENNYAGALSTMGTADLPTLRLAAYRAFYEHMPIRRDAVLGGLDGLLQGQPLRLHQAVDFGRLARLHLLDNRQYRSRPACGPRDSAAQQRVCTPTPEADRSMLGTEQEAWLWESLRRAHTQGSHWNLIAQQTRFTPGDYPRGAHGHPGADSWDGYPETRQRILDALQRERVRNPVFLGGDIHQNWVARVHAQAFDTASPVIGSEFCGTSISSANTLDAAQNERQRQRNPHCLLAQSQWRGYGLVELGADRAEVRLRTVDDAHRADSAVSTLARFEVPSGQPLRALD
jgi:alkaline phosphatase D